MNDIFVELAEYGIEPIVCDPVADADDVKAFYGVDLVSQDELKDLDCLIIAVAHKEFKELSDEAIGAMFRDVPNGKRVVVDIKGARDKDGLLAAGYKYWRL